MVSSFSNPGLPPLHTHPTPLPAIDVCVSVAIDAFEAAMRAAFHEALDFAFANFATKVATNFGRDWALLCRGLAFNDVGDSTLNPMSTISNGEESNPAPMFSDHEESHDLGHLRLQGDGKKPRIPSPITVHSVPPLFSSSPLLLAITASSVKPQSNSNASIATHTNNSKPFFSNQEAPTSVQGFIFPLRNVGTTKTAVPFPLANQHINDYLEEYGVYRSFNSRIICLCMLPSTHTNTTKHRHEVLTSLLSNFTNRKDKWYWILQFILAYYIGVIEIMYEDFLTDKCGWVNWYPVGKFVKKDFYALDLFEKMSEKGSEDRMEISHWRDLYNFENTNYIWNSCNCTIVVEFLVIQFQDISTTFHQYATSGPQVGDELSQFQNVEFNHVAKAVENVGVRWIALPTTSILFQFFFYEKSKRQSECTMGTYFEFIFTLKDHREINFGALTVDLHADFPVLFTSNLDFRPIWDLGDTLAQAVKLMLYLQCKEGKHMDNLFDVQRLLHLLAVSRNIRGALLYEIERYKKKALVEQLVCLAIQLHCSDFNLETNNEENWSKEHNGANITVAMFLIVGTNFLIVQESSIPQYMAELGRHVIMVSSVPTFLAITGKSYNNTKLAIKERMLGLCADKMGFEEKRVAPDTSKGLGGIAKGDEGLVQFQWLDHRHKLVKRNHELPTLYTMDWRDIEFRISKGVDLITMSVVNSAESVKQLKNHLFTKSAKSIRVFAKVADVSEAVRKYVFNIFRSISIVESLFDAFSQQWYSVKLIYALCCLLILILGIVGMHYMVIWWEAQKNL